MHGSGGIGNLGLVNDLASDEARKVAHALVEVVHCPSVAALAFALPIHPKKALASFLAASIP
jgi:hypothetical protein